MLAPRRSVQSPIWFWRPPAGESNSSTFEPKRAGARPHPFRLFSVGTVRIPLRPGWVKCSPIIFFPDLVLCLICFHLPALAPIPSSRTAAYAQLAFASPENVQCRSVFIQFVRVLVSPALSPGTGLQPVFDSRLGRIACKTFSSSFTAL